MIGLLSHNGQWRAVETSRPLSNSVRVQREKLMIMGFAIVRKTAERAELVGGVWSYPPDQWDYDANSLLGHTGIHYDLDAEHVVSHHKLMNKYRPVA